MRIFGLALVGAILAATAHPAAADGLVAAILPTSRSAVTDPGLTGTHAVTVFATVINTSGKDLTQCSIDTSKFVSGLQAVNYAYTLTDPATNLPKGNTGDRFSLRAGASQTMVIAINTSTVIAPVSIRPRFVCSDPSTATVYDALPIDGLDTIVYSASVQQTPDVVALSATTSGDGIVRIQGNGSGAFAVAVSNVGSADTITATVDSGLLPLPLHATLCQTNAGGQCLQAPGTGVSFSLAANATASFAVFVQATGELPFRPDTVRVFVRFADSTQAPRGGTSVAVTNTPTRNAASPVGGIFSTETPFFDPVTGVYRASDGILLVAETGAFQGLNDLGNTTAGVMRIGSDLSLSGSGMDDFATTQGDINAGGYSFTWQGALSQGGSFYAQKKMVNGGSTTDSMQLFAGYQATAYQRTSSFDQIVGAWNFRDAGALIGNISVNEDGSYTGIVAGCQITGQISLIDQRYDMYQMQMTLPTCTVGGIQTLSGLAAVIDDRSPSDTLLFIGSNTAALFGTFEGFTRY
ncbi:MAG TPA: hypothetical protein VGV37_19855 [Aliidongia sp.]|uniref:hypothetical protein n=1 Tax=Aliidongia sp. TaxID=1914230 RepID=UPI002DDD47B4|nr:hypothetical protein [Aliidongia sp.]HEV2676791.1 hypothetical protein [Aliidongia sp.]